MRILLGYPALRLTIHPDHGVSRYKPILADTTREKPIAIMLYLPNTPPLPPAPIPVH